MTIAPVNHLSEMTCLSESTESLNRILNNLPFTLTKEQEIALTKEWQFLNSNETFFLIKGYAGTGKSTIIFAAIKELLRLGKRVVLTAPTNKAVNILLKMAVNNNIQVPAMTIHQLLGLGMVNKGTKKVLAQVNSSCIHLFDCIILDECSMVNSELWQWIEQLFANDLSNNRKVIAMGDPAQLNPVGEKTSPTFDIPNQVQLTQVVRQKQSPLLDFITNWRIALRENELIVPKASYNHNSKINGAFKVQANKLINYSFKKIGQNFAQNPDCFRILCYTNKRVNYYNDLIRNSIYGTVTSAFIEGERLITKLPAIAPDGKTVILPTSTEITVKQAVEVIHHGYRAWRLNVETDEGLTRQIFVRHQDEQKRYNLELGEYLEKAKSNPYWWRKYYWFRDDIFAHVNNCFALTVHNSQGSTFIEGAIDGFDLKKRLYVGDL